MYPISLLEQINKEKKKVMEEKRLRVLDKTVTEIKRYFSHVSVSSVFLTGSLIEPFRFHVNSDIDIAVEGLDESIYFKSISQLEEQLGRVVEIIELEKCKFAESIKNSGLKIL